MVLMSERIEIEKGLCRLSKRGKEAVASAEEVFKACNKLINEWGTGEPWIER